MPDKQVAIRKRQLIENATKRMFIWVAIAAAIVGTGGVVSLSLYKRMAFNNQVISAKKKTVDNLKNNNKIVDELKNNIRVLNTNEALRATPRLPDSEPISAILDALPSQANSSAFGASLQQRILSVDGVAIESLKVDPISGIEDSGDDSAGEASEEGEITFNFTVTVDSGNEKALKEVLQRIESSIRIINLTSVKIEQSNNKITMTANGKAYYQLQKKVEFTKKMVP